MNLVQNALDAMQEQPQARLEIAAGGDERQVWLSLRDSGPGISETDLLKVMDPFFTTKPVGQGSGLGLSISYGIVRDHGGELSIENHPEGGVLARIALPRCRDQGCGTRHKLIDTDDTGEKQW
jgi:two-component system sensor histidine kinase HupT/HoxJ